MENVLIRKTNFTKFGIEYVIVQDSAIISDLDRTLIIYSSHLDYPIKIKIKIV